MAMWLIHAMESRYQGLHGIEDYYFFVGSEKEAMGMGADLSRNVIENYTIRELEEEADEEGYDVEEMIDEDIYFEMYELKENEVPDDITEWENELYEDPEAFIKKHGLYPT